MTPSVKIAFNPLPKQKDFLKSGKRFKVFAGGMGSGKTMVGVAQGIWLSLQYAGNYGLIGRATYPELRDTTWKELLSFPIEVDGEEVPFIESPLIRSYNKANHEIVLCNGSVIIGRALEDSFHKLAKGLNLGWFYGDELTEIAEEVWTGIALGRLRLRLKCPDCKIYPKSSDGEHCPKCNKVTLKHYAFGTTNPEGHDWVWKTFVMTPTKDHVCIQSSSVENKYLSQSYLDGLQSMPEEWKKRYLYGSFETFQGLIYKEFRDVYPFVVPKMEIPEHWYRFIACDWGYRNPCAILWMAVDPKGNTYVYDEYYESGNRVSKIAEIIKLKSNGQTIQQFLIDPSADQDRGNASGKTIVDEFEESNIYFQKANNEVTAGINHVAEYFKLDKQGIPKLRVFKDCVNLRAELQTYKLKDLPIGAKQNEPEKPLKKNDHAVDALRYGIAYLYKSKELERKNKSFDYKEALSRIKGDYEEAWQVA